ncbi:hypothetical protein BHM03_00004156 [Ensete ventricosum]|nr:hypothetical protein BHM03_00004156 [Ensete ventricosum]
MVSSQEVKECAISCMSLVISTFGDNLQRDLSACLPILVDRMGNEITRLTAVKVILSRLYVKMQFDIVLEMLQALQRFFASLVHSANTSFDALLDSLLSSAKPSPQSGGLAKQALYSIAQCVAVLCLAAGDQKCASTVEMLKGILKDDSSMNSALY